MRNDRKLQVLGVLFAGAISLVAAGCGNSSEEAPAASAKTTLGTGIDDSVVTTKVKAALLADPDIKSFDLKVETRKGAVQLSGFVDNQTQVNRAVMTTRGVDGVLSVENVIAVKEGVSTVGNNVDDGIITTKVKSALLADPNVKSFDIAVATNKGEVQLSGYVDSQTQIDQAVALAGKIEGVKKVGNELSIKK